MSGRPAPHLSELAALGAALEWDAQQREQTRGELDREIASAVHAAGPDPVAAGRVWLQAVSAREPDLAARRQRIDSAFAWSTGLSAVLGALAGWLATPGVFYYDGTHRVNVLLVLAVLVVVPALFLLAFLFAALPPRALGWLPGAGWVELAARGLSPGRWALALARWLPSEWRDTWAWWRGRMTAQRALYGGVQKWMLLRASQWFALGYQSAAIITATALVVFTDLAFGWSTTLTTGDPRRDAERVQSVTSTLSSPWSGWVPAASPALELIESSRYFRAAPAQLEPARAARLGGWWRFVILTIIVYGWWPRVLTTAFAQARLQTHLRNAWAATPGLAAVLRRARAAHLQTNAETPELAQKSSPPALADRGAVAVQAPVFAVINWSSCPVSDQVVKARWHVPGVHHAGGASTLEADRATIDTINSQKRDEGDVLVLVKAWEPPLLEFADYIRALRSALGPARLIRVTPVALDEHEQPCAASSPQRDVWQRQLQRIGDPWLQVVSWNEEDAT